MKRRYRAANGSHDGHGGGQCVAVRAGGTHGERQYGVLSDDRFPYVCAWSLLAMNGDSSQPPAFRNDRRMKCSEASGV